MIYNFKFQIYITSLNLKFLNFSDFQRGHYDIPNGVRLNLPIRVEERSFDPSSKSGGDLDKLYLKPMGLSRDDNQAGGVPVTTQMSTQIRLIVQRPLPEQPEAVAEARREVTLLLVSEDLTPQERAVTIYLTRVSVFAADHRVQDNPLLQSE